MSTASEQQANAAAAAAALPTTTNKWPDAAPLPGEDLIFSISCGNSHLHWATHFGEKDNYNPHIFWRTPHLKEKDTESEDLLAILSRNLPDDPHDHIFGKSADATAEDAVAQSKKRAVPLISVYVVSTNRGQEELLAKIWKTVPSRFVVMRGNDFFKQENGAYATMGTDRLATITGAVQLHGHPALVFDGGTATTYSATDSNGMVLGGGIGPGIQSKFRSLTKDTDALPEITPDQVIARVNQAQEKGDPIPTFARSTEEAMMVDAFQEFALKGRNVIAQWLDKAFKKSPDCARPGKANTERIIVCTGGDGDILMQLLQPHYGGVIEHMEENNNAKKKNGSSAPRYKVESSKHLIHYGIACVLFAQVCLRKKKDEFDRNPHMEHIGKRVAKHFGNVEADDGDNIFRGKVVKVVEVEGGGDSEFTIQYDDGDSEDVSKNELFDMFKMYEVHGEKKTKKLISGKGKSNTQKKKAAQKEKATPPAMAQQTTSDRDNTDRSDQSTDGTTNKQKKPEKVVSSGAAVAKKYDANNAKRTSDTETKMPAAKKVKATDGADTKKPPAKKPKTSKAPDAKKPPAKKANEIVALVNTSDPRSFVQKRIAKDFDGETYFGTIIKYDDSENPAFWHVEYDDGDEEDYSKKDLIKALKHYKAKGKNDPKADQES